MALDEVAQLVPGKANRPLCSNSVTVVRVIVVIGSGRVGTSTGLFWHMLIHGFGSSIGHNHGLFDEI